MLSNKSSGALCRDTLWNTEDREVVHKVFEFFFFLTLFPAIVWYTRFCINAFPSTEFSVVYTGFLVRVLFTSTFVWLFGPTSRSDVLVVIG